MKKKHITRNSKILHDTMVSLGALKGVSSALQEMHINEIQVHILDEEGDGVILCLEYDERTGELNKTFSCVDEFYEEGDDAENENALFDEDYYGGRTTFTVNEVLDEETEEQFEEIDEFLKYDSPKSKPLLN